MLRRFLGTLPGNKTPRVQVPNNPVKDLGFEESYTLQSPNLHNYYPKTEYLKFLGPLGPLRV